MSTDFGQDDLPKILARAFLRAWEQYCEADLGGKHCEEVARPFLKGLLVEFANEGVTDEEQLVAAGLRYLISITPKPAPSIRSMKYEARRPRRREVAACAFLHQSRPREISPPMAHLKDGRAPSMLKDDLCFHRVAPLRGRYGDRANVKPADRVKLQRDLAERLMKHCACKRYKSKKKIDWLHRHGTVLSISPVTDNDLPWMGGAWPRCVAVPGCGKRWNEERDPRGTGCWQRRRALQF